MTEDAWIRNLNRVAGIGLLVVGPVLFPLLCLWAWLPEIMDEMKEEFRQLYSRQTLKRIKDGELP